MSRYWDNYPSYSQPSVQELRMRAAASVSSAQKKGQVMEPAIPSSQSGPVCQSWWGQAWCENLERYADFASRLDRGRRYIRIGTVVDLKIRKGRIEARVQGSRRTPYKVEIRISPLSEEKCQTILEKCGKRIQTMEDLVYGRFPEELKELFSQKEDGLFPNPTEISFICSCPDWALMCKHVAAAMYGVGLRLDENPFYFFELRGIDVDRFIDVALENKVESMLEHATARTSRMMDNACIPVLFGITDPEHFIQAEDSRSPSLTSLLSSDEGERPCQADGKAQNLHLIRDSERADLIQPETSSVQESAAAYSSTKDKAFRPELYIQSNDGREISREELAARILSAAPGADHIYVKPGENRAYWTAGDRNGFIELWS